MLSNSKDDFWEKAKSKQYLVHAKNSQQFCIYIAF